jgi:hypothetical protein
MKKVLIGTALVLAIAVGIISGTMALYTTTIDNLASGSVVAKTFTLMESGTDSFVSSVKIAPTESQTWAFSVKNFNGTNISETAMGLAFTLTIAAPAGQTAIAPLVVTVKNDTGTVVGTQTGAGVITFNDSFTLNATGQTHTYTVIVNWPSNNTADASYINANGQYGSAITVKVTGTQQ